MSDLCNALDAWKTLFNQYFVTADLCNEIQEWGFKGLDSIVAYWHPEDFTPLFDQRALLQWRSQSTLFLNKIRDFERILQEKAANSQRKAKPPRHPQAPDLLIWDDIQCKLQPKWWKLINALWNRKPVSSKVLDLQMWPKKAVEESTKRVMCSKLTAHLRKNNIPLDVIYHQKTFQLKDTEPSEK